MEVWVVRISRLFLGRVWVRKRKRKLRVVVKVSLLEVQQSQRLGTLVS